MASARTSDSLTAPRTTRLLVVLAVLGVLVGVAGLVVPRAVGGGGDDADRAAVVARVNDFVTVYNTYDVTELADYQKRMKPLLTDSYYTEFKRITDTVFGALESKDQKSGEAKVLSVAVDTIDDDSAIALAAVDAAVSTGKDEAAVQRHFRWKITLTRSGDQWRVSQFDTVVPMDADTGAAAEGQEGDEPAPEPSPTTKEGDQ